jgi:hypothetical protein
VKAILNATGERGKLNLNYNPFRQHWQLEQYSAYCEFN